MSHGSIEVGSDAIAIVSVLFVAALAGELPAAEALPELPPGFAEDVFPGVLAFPLEVQAAASNANETALIATTVGRRLFETIISFTPSPSDSLSTRSLAITVLEGRLD